MRLGAYLWAPWPHKNKKAFIARPGGGGGGGGGPSTESVSRYSTYIVRMPPDLVICTIHRCFCQRVGAVVYIEDKSFAHAASTTSFSGLVSLNRIERSKTTTEDEAKFPFFLFFSPICVSRLCTLSIARIKWIKMNLMFMQWTHERVALQEEEKCRW